MPDVVCHMTIQYYKFKQRSSNFISGAIPKLLQKFKHAKTKDSLLYYCNDERNNHFVYYRRKRSLGQGNIFCTCLSFCSRGGDWPQCMLGYQSHPTSRPPRDQTPLGPDTLPRSRHAGRYGQQAGVLHPTGMHSCLINLFTNVCRVKYSPLFPH